ncbi:hypothetical protein CYMTET_33586 [Cymbomonas tetramitiformis]|uniref:Ion transport domain-containing protein n=1 Tax=Cymbomonas tetramitiformis TaxID=36881 RepID=A0AAE0FDD1_9CHLO|nr:hypothetical protein CYMTET_33586 [Cymbomonas tetramitiformis]
MLMLIRFSAYYSGTAVLGKALVNSFSAILVTLFFAMVVTLIVGSFVYYFEKGYQTTEAPCCENVLYSSFFIFLIAVAGAGEDDPPSTTTGKFVVVVAIQLGIFFVAMPLAVIGANFIHVSASVSIIPGLRSGVLGSTGTFEFTVWRPGHQGLPDFRGGMNSSVQGCIIFPL